MREIIKKVNEEVISLKKSIREIIKKSIRKIIKKVIESNKVKEEISVNEQ